MQEASATEISERAGAIAADAQADLDKALPALAAAVQCLKELKKAHIDEVKALKKPPGGVRLTLEVACVFFEVAPVKKPDPEDPSKKIFDYVEPAGKSLLSNAGKFLEMLQEFDKDNIPDKVRFEVLRCLHTIFMNRLDQRRRWVVLWLISSAFGRDAVRTGSLKDPRPLSWK